MLPKTDRALRKCPGSMTIKSSNRARSVIGGMSMRSTRWGARLAVLVLGPCLALGLAVRSKGQDESAGPMPVVASKSSKTYHRPTCAAARRITPKNKVQYANPGAAEAQGLKPCNLCRPTEADPSRPRKGRGKAKNKANAQAEAPESKDAPADDGALKFSRDIAPVLVGNCVACHTDGRGSKVLKMTSFQDLMKGSNKTGPVIVPSNPEESELIRRVKGESEGPKMPPGQRNLAPETIAKFEAWIKAGALLDAGIEPTARLDAVAASPEDLRKAALAKLSPEQRDQKLQEVARERWKKASSRTTPETTAGKNFVIFSRLPAARAKALLNTLEAQRLQVGRLLGPATSEALSGPEKVSVYVFNDLPSYVEFVRSIENREVEPGSEAHGRLDVESPYLAAADPLAGGDDPTLHARKPARTRKSQDDEPTGPDRGLAGLLTEQLGASAAGPKAPRWLSYGLGAYLGALVEPRSTYSRKLRQAAAEQWALGWNTKANEILGGEGSPDAIRAVGLSFFEWMGSTYRPILAPFTRAMTQGQEKLDETIHAAWGEMTTREAFLGEWGAWVAARYGRRR